MKRRLVLFFAFVLVIVGALGVGLVYLNSVTPGPLPTNTPVPGLATRVFEGVNQARSSQEQPTLTPGPGVETLVQQWIELTAVSRTPTSTFSPSPSRTPLPTHTARPTNTLIPGFATMVHQGVNEALATQGRETFTPGPELATVIQAAIEATLASPTPSVTPSS